MAFAAPSSRSLPGSCGGAGQPVPPPPPAVRFITGASADGTFLVDQTGTPRLFVCEDVWNIIWLGGAWNGGNWQPVYSAYLSQRAAQGYTATEVSFASYPYDLNPPATPTDGSDWDGTYPFNSTTDPSSGFNEAFWVRRDYFFAQAALNGITVVCNASTPLLEDPTDMCTQWTTQQWTDYGTHLGNRYKNTPNIMWITGDDYFGTVDTGLFAWLAALRATGDTHLCSIQNMQETTSRYAYNPTTGSDPLSFDVTSQYDWVYTYNPAYNGVVYGCTAEPSASDHVQGRVPVIWGDGAYLASSTTSPQTDTHLVQQMIWWAMSSGACGFSTGDNDIWPWASGAAALVTGKTFYTAEIPAVAACLRALPGWQKLRPDASSTLVTSGRNTPAANIATGAPPYQANTDNYVTAAYAADGTLAIIYCGVAFDITINQSVMQPGYTAAWVDPGTGAQTPASPGSGFDSAAMGTNSSGFTDWALVLRA